MKWSTEIGFGHQNNAVFVQLMTKNGKNMHIELHLACTLSFLTQNDVAGIIAKTPHLSKQQ